MEKNIRIISGVFFIVALSFWFLTAAYPLQARLEQIKPNVTWRDSAYQLVDTILTTKNLPVIPFPVNSVPASVSAALSSGQLKTEALPNPDSNNPSVIESSSSANNQQLLLIILLMASAKNN